MNQIVVVDMHSTDATCDIAKQFGAEVHLHEPLGYADPARAFALDQCTGDYILMLDADEVVPIELSQRLCEIADRGDVDVVSVPYINYLLGAPILHTGWGPDADRHDRFFRRGSLRANAEIHRFLKPQPGARRLKLPFHPNRSIVHFNYIDIAQFVEKLNRYTTIEAQQAHERGDTLTIGYALRSSLSEFLRRFVTLKGYKDGWRGFYLSALMGVYKLVTCGKWLERRECGTRQEVQRLYASEAERIIGAYGVDKEGGAR